MAKKKTKKRNLWIGCLCPICGEPHLLYANKYQIKIKGCPKINCQSCIHGILHPTGYKQKKTKNRKTPARQSRGFKREDWKSYQHSIDIECWRSERNRSASARG